MHQSLTKLWFGGETFFYRGAMVVLYGMLFWTVSRSPLLDARLATLNFLGTISFGVYLFHNLPLVWLEPHLPAGMAVVACTLLSMLLAWLSWQFIEAPLQRSGKPALARWHSRRCGDEA